MPTLPLELVVVERFPPFFRAYRWTNSKADADCMPRHVLDELQRIHVPLNHETMTYDWASLTGQWVLWNEIGYCARIVKDSDLRAMYQLPSGEPIP